jgi:hypothetical protein
MIEFLPVKKLEARKKLWRNRTVEKKAKESVKEREEERRERVERVFSFFPSSFRFSVTAWRTAEFLPALYGGVGKKHKNSRAPPTSSS